MLRQRPAPGSSWTGTEPYYPPAGPGPSRRAPGWTAVARPAIRPRRRRVTIDGSKIDKLDSAGAWLLLRTKRTLEAAGKKVGALTLPDRYVPLLENLEQEHKAPPARRRRRSFFRERLYRIGKATIHTARQGWSMLGYLGRVTVETLEAFTAPKTNIRFAAMVHQIEETGINALPIVGLLSFLIGVVIAYQGIEQLKKFSAEFHTIDGLGIITLREMGVLMTSIIVAGRSPARPSPPRSAPCAINEEIDAMQTIGLNTIDVLVLPRIIGLVIALPILTLYADFMGLLGGGIMCYFNLGVTVPAFLRELQASINVNTLMVGLIKAPVFAFVIALVGCYEGLQVERNAASVGLLTTRSVVESVFLVIVLDAAFSVMFSVLGV